MDSRVDKLPEDHAQTVRRAHKDGIEAKQGMWRHELHVGLSRFSELAEEGGVEA